MTITEKSTLSPAEKEQVKTMWNGEYPSSLSFNSIADLDIFFNNVQNPKHYCCTEANTLAAWMSIFTRDEEIWFSIIINKNHQKRGIGRMLLNKAKECYSVLNCWVVDEDSYLKQDGTPYSSPLKFYQKNGFEVLSEIRLNTEKLSAVKIRWTK